MKYNRRCTVIVYTNSQGSNYDILFPVNKSGVRNKRHTRIIGPIFVHRATRNSEINKLKTALRLEEVKRKHINLSDMI